MKSSDEQSPIVIACSTDERYAPGLAVMVRSMLDHHPGARRIQLYVLESDLQKKTKEKLLASWKDSRLSVTFLKPETTKIENLTRFNGVHQAMYFHLMLSELLPHHHKILKMDADMLLFADIEELWNTDLTSHPAAAALELRSPTVSSEWALPNYKELGIPPQTPYFNAGLMLINLDMWRKEEIAAKIIDHTKRYEKIIRYWDQDGVNAVLGGRFLILDPRWNVEAEGLILTGWVPEDPMMVKEIINDAKIVHFVVSKPWNQDCKHPKKLLFLDTLKRTAFNPEYKTPLLQRLAQRILSGR